MELAHPTYRLQWSPDGSYVLAPLDVFYVIQTDGSSLRQVFRDVDYNNASYSPDLSPDGSRIVYTTARHRINVPGAISPNFQIESSRLDGSDRRRLTDNDSLDTAPAWSPDGQRIAFVKLSFGAEESGLYTMAADGSDVRRIVYFKDAFILHHYWVPVWSPDGKTIAFMGNSGLGNALYTVEADGSGLRQLYPDLRVTEPGEFPGSVGGPLAWSPDGQEIAFLYSYTKNASGFARTTELYVIGRDGDGLRRIREIAGQAVRGSLEWSPDGAKILLAAGGAVNLIDVDGSASRMLVAATRASWSLDGSKIAIFEPGGRDLVFAWMAVDGLELHILTRRNAQGKLVSGIPPRSDGTVDLAPCSREPNFFRRVLGSSTLVVPEPGENPGLVRDCETLLTIRDALAGDAEIDWNADTPITEWDGVTVDGSPLRVRELELPDRGLSGVIPPELGRLTKLRSLNLRNSPYSPNPTRVYGAPLSYYRTPFPTPQPTPNHNRLTGTIPAELGNLTELETLALEGNYLSAPIPPELSTLANLVEVDLSGNYLAGCVPVELPEIWVEASGLERCKPDEETGP